MGFLDKVKGTAKQAVNPGGQMKERDKITKINASGIDATATVDSMQEVGSQIGGGHQIDFELTVHPTGGADYKAGWSLPSSSIGATPRRPVAVPSDRHPRWPLCPHPATHERGPEQPRLGGLASQTGPVRTEWHSVNVGRLGWVATCARAP